MSISSYHSMMSATAATGFVGRFGSGSDSDGDSHHHMSGVDSSCQLTLDQERQFAAICEDGAVALSWLSASCVDELRRSESADTENQTSSTQSEPEPPLASVSVSVSAPSAFTAATASVASPSMLPQLLQRVQRLMEEARGCYAEVRDENTMLRQRLHAKSADFSRLQSQREQAQRSSESVDMEIEDCRSRAQEAVRVTAELRGRHARLETAYRQLEADVAGLRESTAHYQEQYRGVTQSLLMLQRDFVATIPDNSAIGDINSVRDVVLGLGLGNDSSDSAPAAESGSGSRSGRKSVLVDAEEVADDICRDFLSDTTVVNTTTTTPGAAVGDVSVSGALDFNAMSPIAAAPSDHGRRRIAGGGQGRHAVAVTPGVPDHHHHHQNNNIHVLTATADSMPSPLSPTAVVYDDADTPSFLRSSVPNRLSSGSSASCPSSVLRISSGNPLEHCLNTDNNTSTPFASSSTRKAYAVTPPAVWTTSENEAVRRSESDESGEARSPRLRFELSPQSTHLPSHTPGPGSVNTSTTLSAATAAATPLPLPLQKTHFQYICRSSATVSDHRNRHGNSTPSTEPRRFSPEERRGQGSGRGRDPSATPMTVAVDVDTDLGVDAADRTQLLYSNSNSSAPLPPPPPPLPAERSDHIYVHSNCRHWGLIPPQQQQYISAAAGSPGCIKRKIVFATGGGDGIRTHTHAHAHTHKMDMSIPDYKVRSSAVSVIKKKIATTTPSPAAAAVRTPLPAHLRGDVPWMQPTFPVAGAVIGSSGGRPPFK